MIKEISDDVTNSVKRTSHRQHHRSRSLDAFDNLDLLEAQKLFRQKYLKNRAVFESSTNDATDNVRPIKDCVIPKSRRFSTEAERSSTTVLESTASTNVKSNEEDVLKAPSLVRDIYTKYITPVHKSMLETKFKEAPPKSLSNSLPVTSLNRSANNNVHLRRTMSAREGNLNGRNDSRVNGVEPLQNRWAQPATTTDHHFKSAKHYHWKHSSSEKFDVTDSAINGAEKRQTNWTQQAVDMCEDSNSSQFQSSVHYPRKHSPLVTADEVDSDLSRTGTFHIKRSYPTMGAGDVWNTSDFKPPPSYTRVYSLPTIDNKTGEGVSKTAKNKLNNKSSLFVYLHHPTSSSVPKDAAQGHQQDKQGAIANNTRVTTMEGNEQSGFLFPLGINTRKADNTIQSLESQNGAEISDSPGVFAASPRTPLAYSTYKMEVLNKTWKPVPVHRHNSFNDSTTQDICKTRDYRSISRTKSDLDKYRTIAGTSNQNNFAIDKPRSIRSTLPLMSPPSTKLVVKAQDEILPSTATLKTQFRKFNPPTS